MRVAVMGAGGIGGYLAARLGAAGADVAVIARGPHLTALRRSGLRLFSEKGALHLSDLRAVDDPAAVGPVDVVLFTVKMFDAAAAAEQIRPMVGPDTAVVTFLNGVDSVDVLCRAHGRDHVLGGSAYIFATVVEPGVIHHTGPTDRFVFGELDGTLSPRVEALRAALEAAGVEAVASDRILSVIWEKFIILASNSGLTAVTRMPLGPLRIHPDTRALFVEAMREVEAVARARGIAVADDIVERHLAFFDRLDPASKASMLVDLERGRPLELPWLSGAVVRLGAELGVATPVHRFFAAALVLHAEGRPG